MSTDVIPQDLWDPLKFDHLTRGAHEAPSSKEAWLYLEAAHIVGQMRWRPHLEVHGRMLRLALKERNWSEVFGQAFRLSLVPLGHLFQRLPRGNTGRSHVSAFKPMTIRAELLLLIDRMGKP